MEMVQVTLQILLFCSAIYSIASTRIAISNINSFNKEAIDALSSQLNDKSIALLSFGFDHSKKSKLLIHSLYDAIGYESHSEDESTATSCMVINGANPQYLRQISMPSVVVGFLPKTLLVSDPTTLLNHIKAYIDGVFYRKTSSKTIATSNLILLVEQDADIEPFKKIVDWMLEEAAHPEKDKIQVTFLSTNDSLPEEAKAKVFQVMEATSGGSTKDLMQSLVRIDSQSPKSIKSSDREVNAAMDCRVLCDNFLSTFKRKLKAINAAPALATTTYMSSGVVNNTMQALQNAIDESVEVNYADNADLFERMAGSHAFASAAYRSRTEMTDMIMPLYDRIVASTVQRNLDLFDKRLLRVPANPKLPKNLQTVGKRTAEDCGNAVKTVRRDFKALCCMPSSNGLFSIRDHRSFEGSLKRKLSRKSQLLRFAADIEDRVKERIDSLFLGGQYNPYVRDAPFPPTHINLNYLIDPRAVILGMQYDGVYDEHLDAVVPDRADPLLFPGVSTTIVVDPNAKPSSKETETPWTELVRDFFTEE